MNLYHSSTPHAPPSTNLVDRLRFWSDHQAAQPAFYFLGEQDQVTQVTYSELDRQARAIAARLTGLGFHGERALLLYPPGIDFIAAFFGCLYAGTTAVPALPPRRNRNMTRVEAISDDAQAAVILSVYEVVQRSANVLADDAPHLADVPWIATDRISSELADSWLPTELVDDSLAVLQYTSGSTGRPKGVMLTHANLMHNCGLITYGFAADRHSVGLSWLPTYHDMGLVGGVLNPLYVGRPSVLMSPMSFLQKPVRWLRGISKFGVTISGGPNFAYALCNEKITERDCQDLDLSTWKVAFNGAEPVRARTLAEFTEKFKRYGFRAEAHYPCYGMAEATLIITGSEFGKRPLVNAFDAIELESNRVVPVDQESATARLLVASGRVLPDQQVAIVDPQTCERLSANQVGEIWVESDSVAQGYWNNLEATSLAFHGSLANEHQSQFLRTGDLGFLHNEQLFVTGRTKDLIIINGRNIYPHDIESVAERAHEANRVGGVAAFSIDAGNTEHLVIAQELERGYRKFDPHEVAAAIREAVLESLEVAPQAIVLLKPGRLPKTSSGKVQRRECREQYISAQLDVLSQWQLGEETESQAPATMPQVTPNEAAAVLVATGPSVAAIENWLGQRISERLKIPQAKVDFNESFAHFGLDSVALIGISGELEDWLDRPVSPRLLFTYPTIAELSKHLATTEAPAANSISIGNKSARAETGMDKSASEILASFDELTDGQIKDMLRQLLEAKAREETFSHSASQGQQALWFIYQLDRESSAYNIMYAARVSADFDREAFRCAFQSLLGRHETLRTTYSTVDDRLVQRIHPYRDFELQIVDARHWQADVLETQLQSAADAPFDLEQGPVVRVQLFERQGEHHILLFTVHHVALDFWSFDVLFDELETLYRKEAGGEKRNLPPAKATYRDFVRWQEDWLESSEGQRQWEYWQQQLAGELPALDLPTNYPRPPIQTFRGRSYLFKLPHGLLQRLSELSKSNDVTLFTTILAAFQVLLYRYSGQEDVVVGCPTAGRNRAEFESVLGYFVNPVAIRARLSPRQSFTSFLGQVRETVIGGITNQDFPFPVLVERLRVTRDPSRSPIFQAAFGWDQPRRLQLDDEPDHRSNGKPPQPGSLDLQPFLLGQQGSAFDLMLMVLHRGDGLSASLQYNLDLFEEATIARMADHFQVLLASLADNPEQALADLPILSQTEQQRLLTDWNAASASYPSCCAHELVEQQVRRTPEAIAVQYEDLQLTYRELNERANQVAHYLVELGVGPETLVGIYVDRSLEMIVGLLGVLKAGGAYVPLSPGTPRDRLAYMLDEVQAAVILSQHDLASELPETGAEIVCLDRDWSTIAGASKTDRPPESGPTNLAYVIFTSGSTGKPKGVQIEHRSVVNFLTSMQLTPGIAADDVLLAVTTYTFDISVLELLLPLTVGAHVVIVSPEVAADGIQLARAIGETGTTIMQATPATWRLLIEAGWTGDQKLKVLCGGEALPGDLAEQLRGRCASLWNMYGPTETTIWSAVERVQQRSQSISLGRPIANTQIYVLDSRLIPVPEGVTGSLYIGGDGLARGYLHRPDLTAEKFIRDPFGGDDQARLYKTGDLARYQADGKIEFLGREDFQVKVRGFRIELGEIESCLNEHPAIRQSVVIARNASSRINDKHLVAYCTYCDGVPDNRELRNFLKRTLPDYMVPAVFVPLDEFPLNSAGKIDRRSLPAPENSQPNLHVSKVAPRNDTEEKLAAIWAKVLRLEGVGIHDNFFDLGGASMQSLEITSLAAEVGIEMVPASLFKHPTIAELAAVVVTSAGEETGCPAEFDLPPRLLRSTACEPTASAETITVGQPTTDKVNIVIESIGVYLPFRSVSTDEVIAGCRHQVTFPLEEMTGIKSRRLAAENEFTTDLAYQAVEECLRNSKYSEDQIDLVICCHIDRSVSPRSSALEPCTAMYLKRQFGFPNAVAFDVSNACAGMFTGISVAKAFIASGAAQRVLVVSAEYLSPVMKTAQREISGFMDPRMACLTLGDAAAAIILEAASGNEVGFHELELYSLGKYNSLCIGRPSEHDNGGPILHVPDPIKHTSIAIEQSIAHSKHVLGRVPWELDQIQQVIMHQTSERSLLDGARAINESFEFEVCTPETTINNLSERGNTASTSHIVAIWDSILQGRINTGDRSVFAITGSGQTIGTGVYTFDDLPDRIRQRQQTGNSIAKTSRLGGTPRSVRLRRCSRLRAESVGIISTKSVEPTDTIAMVKEAVENCLANSAYDKSELDLVLYAGVYRTEFIFEPAMAAIIAGELGINDDVKPTDRQRTFAFDVFNGAVGFLNACDIASQMIGTGEIRTALVIASEVENNRDRYPDKIIGLKETASAIILDQSPDARVGFGDFVFKYLPEELNSRVVTGKYQAGSPCVYLQQDPDILELYLKLIPEAVNELLQQEGLTTSAIRVVLPPQFSSDFLEALSRVLAIPRARFVDLTGDGRDWFTSALPYSLREIETGEAAQPGDIGLVVSVGSGLQVGCAVYYF